MQVYFHKYQGTGNDFIMLDNRNNQYSALTQKEIKTLCDRHFGIGADGLILLNLIAGYDFEMKYYNADGNESSMCGNGGRCIVKYAYAMGIHKSEYRFLAVDGEHEAEIEIDGGWVNLKMKDVDALTARDNHFLLNTGSPHYVTMVDDVMSKNVKEEGRKIRYSHTFEKEGVNVNFVEQLEKKIIVRTYERGVEDETLSCGTGVTASALVCAHNERGFNSVDIQTPGGNLCVEFDKLDEDIFANIWLCGPAEKVFEGLMDVGG
jgi:diaminopimelate epimerase